MKFCKDCKHCEWGWGQARCGRTGGIDLVSGGKKRPEFSCKVERGDYIISCGPEAKFFEPIVESSPELVDNQQEVLHNPTFIESVVKFFKRS